MQILIVAGAGSVSPDIMIAIYLRERTQRGAGGGPARTHCTRARGETTANYE